MPHHRDDERVGATLRQFREMRGLKPDELANRVQISRAYLANIEAGRKRLTPVLLARIATELCVPQIAIVRPEPVAVEATA
jgi:transcriptional regulator with XRE-family HTH domain